MCPSAREITIRVNGNLKRDLMTQVTYELDKINKSFNRLHYEKLIPCNCDTCLNSQNPHGYDYELLLNKLDSQKYTIDCEQRPFHTVLISSLIDNSLIDNDPEKELSTLKNEEESIHQINVAPQIIVRIGDEKEIKNDSSHNKQEITLKEGNYTQQIGENNQLSNGNQSPVTSEKQNQPLQKKFDKNFIIGLVSIFLALVAILVNGIFNEQIRTLLFPNSTQKLEQQEKGNNK